MLANWLQSSQNESHTLLMEASHDPDPTTNPMGHPNEFDDRDVRGLWGLGLVRLLRQNPNG